VTPQDFLAELNHPTKERRDAAAAALGMGMKQVANADAVKKAGEKKDAEMLQLEKERQVRQEKATEAADKDTKLTWSEKPAEGALWFDKKTRQPVMSISPEEPMRAGMKSGKYVRFASATAAEMLPAFESAFSTLDKLYTIAKRNPSAIAWGSSGKFSGPASMMSKDVAEVQALMGLGLSNLVRTQGEKGNLSEGDVQRAMNALGGLSSGGGYERKLQTVLDSLNSSLKVKGFEPFKFSYKEPEKGAPPERRLPGGLKF
jgi:hypothetical protein